MGGPAVLLVIFYEGQTDKTFNCYQSCCPTRFSIVFLKIFIDQDRGLGIFHNTRWPPHKLGAFGKPRMIPSPSLDELRISRGEPSETRCCCREDVLFIYTLIKPLLYVNFVKSYAQIHGFTYWGSLRFAAMLGVHLSSMPHVHDFSP
jgi:hypothetical protein